MTVAGGDRQKHGPHFLWTPDMDLALIIGVACKHSRRAMARALGVSESGAVARFNRILRKRFPSDQIRTAKRNLRRMGAR
jgi:hypothetical protein